MESISLDQVDFVFRDHRKEPYRVRAFQDGIYLMRWNAQLSRWFNLRTLFIDEVVVYSCLRMKRSERAAFEGELPFLDSAKRKT